MGSLSYRELRRSTLESNHISPDMTNEPETSRSANNEKSNGIVHTPVSIGFDSVVRISTSSAIGRKLPLTPRWRHHQRWISLRRFRLRNSDVTATDHRLPFLAKLFQTSFKMKASQNRTLKIFVSITRLKVSKFNYIFYKVWDVFLNGKAQSAMDENN